MAEIALSTARRQGGTAIKGLQLPFNAPNNVDPADIHTDGATSEQDKQIIEIISEGAGQRSGTK